MGNNNNVVNFLSTKQKSRKKYTDDQIRALQLMQDFILSEKQFFRLSGYAGTGKTFIIHKLIEESNLAGLSIAFAAPSNQAVKNFVSANEDISPDVFCLTVAQLLKLHPLFCEAIGEEIFISSPGTLNLEDFDLIIIDEYSMLSSKDFDRLVDTVLDSTTQVIFVGDPAQIPPVKEAVPIVEYSDLIDESHTLKEVVRHSGDILRATVKLREGFNVKWRDYDGGSVKLLGVRDWLRKMDDYYTDPKYIIDSNYVKTLAWRNRTVSYYNEKIRDAFLGVGHSKEEFLPGDLLIVKKPVIREVTVQGAKNNRIRRKKAVVLPTSEEVEVISVVAKRTYRLPINGGWREFPYYEILVSCKSRDFVTTVIIPTCDSRLEIVQSLYQLKELALKTLDWDKYKNLYYFFDDLDYSYALTVHKSQGSTYNVVFIDVADLRTSKDRDKLLYTAFSRAKNKVYLCTEDL